ncbi:NAD(+) synthase, partial [bacterium]|nr:NAD(+) synthase [bacterium]
GYSTLYGDTAGAIGVLGDLTKAQVYALARWLNTQGAGIPERVLERAPSAELRPDQKDEDSLPAYAVLDPLVEAAVVGNQGAEALKAAGHPPEATALFLRLYRQSEFKRRQFPPVLRVSRRAFGRGRRIPVAARRPF